MSESSAIADGVDVDALADAIAACRAVARLGSPGPGAAATYLPGRRISGIRIGDGRVAVEVVSRWGYPVGAVAEQVRAAAVHWTAGRPVDVAIIDVELPGQQDPPGSGAAAQVQPISSPQTEVSK